ncbi:Myb DNA-bind 4 domain containing protein [Asbolus verrucosus]|uniref:Myb DNA-bind 4 domain containing protein n=1 Tax=Asbolus verrucosus TaxID=1661398 RepID=A0A482VZ58_ASBVE|nr:Myb DNA-bind 4 domain containing protein [Asbolus verrucosus]
MSATQLYLNDQLVTITAEASIIKKLNEGDDQYLAEYVNKAAKLGQFNFLLKDHQLRKIVVRRACNPTVDSCKPVWYKKGRPSEIDLAAIAFLLKLRGSDKYFSRFQDGYSVRNKLWDEIANDMKAEGYDVDGHKCSQKFFNLAQNYYKYRQYVESRCGDDQKAFPPDYYAELHKILGEKKNDEGNNSEEEDEEWLPKNKKRKRNVDEDGDDFFKKLLKKNSEQKEQRFYEMCDLIKKRNDMIKEKLKQNDKIISILEKLVKN